MHLQTGCNWTPRETFISPAFSFRLRIGSRAFLCSREASARRFWDVATVMPVVSGIIPSALPTLTLPGSIASVAQEQIPAGSSTAAVNLEVADGSGTTFLIRGPEMVIWARPAN